VLASETMPLVAERFDLVVLGGGSAARDGANMAMRDYDARVALVERVRWGGSCPNVACSPTKAYLVAAELAHDLNSRAPVIGIETGPARVDLARVRAWKESLKKTQEQWVRDLEGAGLATFSEQATFTGLVFGTTFLVTGQIWIPMIAHAAFDLTALAMIYSNVESSVAHWIFK